MRKSSIFISAALTTFALVMVYGVVYAYHGLAAANPTPQVEATAQTLTPEQAAQIAAQVLGRTDLLSAESTSINGVDAYKITFQSGSVVYVGLDKQIISIQTVPQVIMVPAQTTQHQSNNQNTGNNNTVNASNASHNTGGEHDHGDGD